MAATISEIIQQPRTGIQWTSLGTYGKSAKQGEKQFSWDKEYAKNVTLGYSHAQGHSDLTGCNAGQWAWQVGGNSEVLCIDPVKELCAMNTWDGYDYNVKNWGARYWPNGDNPLLDKVKSASFVTPCKNAHNGERGGGEFTTVTDTCDLRCVYDPSKFTDLRSVQAWEQRYGKYDRELGKSTAREDRRVSSGTTLPLETSSKPFSDNYEAIMQHFCSQPNTNCQVDPMTGKPGVACSNLKSSGPEGDACRYWMNSYGPTKWKQMSAIGNKYCTQHPASYDCRCFSRADPENPDSKTFKQISGSLTGIENNPGCYYLPCADPTTYIVGQDIMHLQPDPEQVSSTYGLNCASKLCANVVDLNDGTYAEMNGNDLYIHCGAGDTDAPTSGDMGTFFNETYENNLVLFILIIACMAAVALSLVFGAAYWLQTPRKPGA